MQILVAYGSRLGATAVIAEEIAEVLRRVPADVLVQPAEMAVTIDPFDAVVIGGGIYASRWHPESIGFVRRHAGPLGRRPVWFFSSGPVGDSAVGAPVPPAGMDELVELVHPRDQAIFGGAHDRAEVDASELSRLEKFIARRFVPEGDWRDWDAIARWAETIALELRGSSVPAR
jgi:menaquinone-dependent protoporphyrinogen oxidase